MDAVGGFLVSIALIVLFFCIEFGWKPQVHHVKVGHRTVVCLSSPTLSLSCDWGGR